MEEECGTVLSTWDDWLQGEGAQDFCDRCGDVDFTEEREDGYLCEACACADPNGEQGILGL